MANFGKFANLSLSGWKAGTLTQTVSVGQNAHIGLWGAVTMGTIYVIGAGGESMKAAGGPPVGRPDRGGHTIDPTPAGNYVLGPRIHVVAPSWPTSAIPWGAALRLNAAGEVEYEASPG